MSENGARLLDIYPDRVPVEKDGRVAALTDYIRPRPVYDGNALLGYPGVLEKNAAAFTHMGLLGSDVIVAINGTPLNETTIAGDALGA